MTQTYTLATLEVLPTTHQDIKVRLELAGYAHAIDHDTGCIDMTGLSLLTMQPSPAPPIRSWTRERLDDVADKIANSRVDFVFEKDSPSASTSLKSFRHYKGGTYTLLMVARDSEERDDMLAVYVSHQTQQVWARPWPMFNEVVLWPDGVRRPRFIEMTPDDPAST